MERTRTTCLIILTTIAVGISLYFLRTVLLPFVIAVFIVIGIRPILEFLQKRLGLHQMVAFGVTFLTSVALLVLLGVMVGASINDLSKNPEAYEQRLNTIVNWFAVRMSEKNEERAAEAEGQPKNDNKAAAKIDAAKIDAAEKTSQAVQDMMHSASDYLQSLLFTLVGSLSSLLSNGVLILIFVFFLLLEHGSGHPNRPELLDEIELQVRKYIVMKTVISFLTGLVFGLVLWIFGVPLAILFGVLAFVLNYIPNIGPLVANALPIPFLVLNSELNPVAAITCLVLISAVQFISGNVVETRLMGKSFDVSPTVLLLALMFFGLIWGIVGMFLATPIVSIVKIVLKQSKAGRPVAELMAGRLSTDESGQA